MKKLYLKIFGVLLLVFLSQLAFAKLADKPKLCPNVAAIKAGGLRFVDYYCADGTYTTGQLSSYNTAEAWGFLIKHIQASREDEAMKKGLAALPTLSGAPQPSFEPDYGWACKYQIGEQDLEAIAFVMEN